MIALVIGLVTNRLGELLIFLLLYVPLRSFCGGWHADKLWKCTIYSNSMLILLCITISYEKIFFRPIIMVLIFIIGIILLYVIDSIKIKKDLIYTEQIKELNEIFNSKINEDIKGIKDIKGLGIKEYIINGAQNISKKLSDTNNS